MKIIKAVSKYNLKRGITFPKRSEDLAEFIGILTGDGYIGQYILADRVISSIEISANLVKDEGYIKNFVAPLVKVLFNLEPNIYARESQNTLRLVIYSKDIVQFINELGFPLGNKGFIFPPKWILNNESLFKRFIRGFFDTDGCIVFKNKEGKKYPVVSMGSKSKPLLECISAFLRSKETPSYLGQIISKDPRFKKESITYKLEINGSKNTSFFYQLIGSNNPRNKSKYGELTKNGDTGSRTQGT
ncbi:MAG TPA: LAGLIDADG family homing endonuclease [Candidatus Nanoarchaeia archaeon]|nr:LAGLIDADG family homing endonuclease [Candidatus Nanoarchaeia archaeon]